MSSLKGTPHTKEHNKKVSEALQNLKFTNPEAWARMKKGSDWTGKKHTEASKLKSSESHKKLYKEHPEILEKLRNAALGKRQTQEQKTKISLGVNRAYQRILDEANKLKEQGYRVIPIAHVIPDIIAIKDGKVYAFEVEYGFARYTKYNKDNFKQYFDEVIWLLRGKRHIY